MIVDMAEPRLTTPVNWCTTQSEIIPTAFRWNIRNFSHHLREIGYKLTSTTFSSEDSRYKPKWYLELYPKGETKESDGYLSLFLMFEPDSTETANVMFEMSILSSEAEKSFNETKSAKSYQFSETTISWGWLKFISTERLLNKSNELIQDDTLTIYCEIKLLTGPINSSGRTSNPIKIPECRFGKDFNKLFDTGFLSDVILMACGKQFKVHKSVLTARSPVFAAMFDFEMKGKNRTVIEIDDISDDVLYNLLKYIYSGKAPEETTVKSISDLLSAADKYDLERLKIICGKILGSETNIENATELLILADMHNATELKEVVMDFINTHIAAVKKADTWVTLINFRTSLLDEVLEYHLRHEHKNNDM